MNLQSRIFQVVSDVFVIPVDNLEESMTPIDIKKWDSLGQLHLITAIEQNFNILFETADVFKIVSIRSIIDLVKEKVGDGV
jgi:acyl carrier protein